MFRGKMVWLAVSKAGGNTVAKQFPSLFGEDIEQGCDRADDVVTKMT